MTQDTSDDGGERNTVSESNRNVMDSPEADGNVEQHNEVHQHYHDDNGTAMPDPRSTNAWINFCKWVAGLPISEAKLLGGLTGTGSLAFLGLLLLTTPWNGYSVHPSQFELLIGLAALFAVPIGFVMGYMQTDVDARCPECEERFALREVATRKTGVTEHQGRPDTVHGEQDFECVTCGHEKTITATWPANEIS